MTILSTPALCNLLLLLLVTVPLAWAHIHSQKVSVEREKLTLSTWLCALVSSALVGVCGVFPLVLNKWIKLDKGCKGQLAFKAVLSFAVGGLLGDVFLHLLPEAYGTSGGDVHGTGIGLWVIVGFLSFLLVEKLMKFTEELSGDNDCSVHSVSSNCGGSEATRCDRKDNGFLERTPNGKHLNGLQSQQLHRRDIAHTAAPATVDTAASSPLPPSPSPPSSHSRWLDKDISGYLNLVANSTDNFTHGLAIAASYVASPAVGLLTTLAILCHEIPHEVGDFAILLNSGFSLKEAAKAQILTASGGLVGVVAGLTAEQLSNASTWLLPFTAGGFLYIALVSIIPDLLEEHSNVRHSVVEMLALGVGIVIMALVTIVERKSCGHMPASSPT